jgi:phage terminase large subunit
MHAKIPEPFEPLLEPHRYKVFRGGRGGAKSRTFATILIMLARMGQERILCCREIQRSIKDSVKRILDDEIQRHDLGKEFTSTTTEIRHNTTGSLFIFAGLRTDPDAIKSIEGVTRAWVEEAHTVSQASLDILIPTVRAENSEIWFSYNPRFEDDPVHAMFAADPPPPRSIVVDVQYWDNPWFPAVLYEEMEYCRQRDTDKYLHVWEGKPVSQSDEQVMHGVWKIEPVPEPPADAILKFGVDWGFSSDPLAVTRSWQDGDTIYIDYEAGGQGVKLTDIPAKIKEVPGADRWPITADNQRPDTIDYCQDQGLTIAGCKKGKGSIEDGIEFLRGHQIIIDPRCVETINEFIHYRYKKDPRTDQITPVIIDANNHYIDSLRYSWEGVYKKITAGMDLS